VSYRRTRIGGDVEAYRVNGTPADCVALGIFHHSGIDVVLSGVNLGTNLGNGIWHSGTLAAARQASLLGVRGIALSTPVVSDDPDLEGLDPQIARVLELLLARNDLRLVNVNLPARPRGIYWARQAVEKYDGEVVPAEDPYGRPVYWLAVSQLREHKPDTDLWAFERGYITITPLRLDLTSHSALSTLAEDRVIEFEDEPEPQVISDEEAAKENDESLRSEAWKPGETTSTISKR